MCRNKPIKITTIRRYFTGGGLLTWLFSPFNLFLDLLSLKNKGIYRFADLSEEYQKEISTLLYDVNVNKKFITTEMFNKVSKLDRGMCFFKWYGDNLDTSILLPCFNKQYKYIQTIGVSTFNKQTATSVHFGPLRITLRLLYNLTPTNDGDVYIQVGEKKHYWKSDALFIFDDTLQHQSVNYSEQMRHCMFIDMIRPTKFPSFLFGLLNVIRIITAKINRVFYYRWVIIP